MVFNHGCLITMAYSDGRVTPKRYSDQNKSTIMVNAKPSLEPSSQLNEPAEFLRCVEKLAASTQTVDKHLENIQRVGREFHEFEKQELKLAAIK